MTLKSMLSGRRLPLLGGNQEYVDIMFKALGKSESGIEMNEKFRRGLTDLLISLGRDVLLNLTLPRYQEEAFLKNYAGCSMFITDQSLNRVITEVKALPR